MYICVMAKNIIFDVLFYQPDALAAISNGSDWENYTDKEHIYYSPCMIDVDRVESAAPSYRYKKHTTVIMYTGEEYILKFPINDYFQLVDHVLASKAICRLKN